MDAAIKQGAGSIEAVEHGELSVFLITVEFQRRDLGVVRKRRECRLPRLERLVVLLLLARAEMIVIRELSVSVGVHVSWEHLDQDGALRGGADVVGHGVTDKIVDPDEVVGEIVVETGVQRVHVYM